MKIFIEYEELNKRVELFIPGHYRLKKIKVGIFLMGITGPSGRLPANGIFRFRTQ